MSNAALWREVIEQAVRDILFPETEFPNVPALYAAGVRAEAFEWIMSDSKSEYSYLWACKVTGSDPSVSRAKIQQMELGLW